MYTDIEKFKSNLLANDNKDSKELNYQLELILENPSAYKDAVSKIVFNLSGKRRSNEELENEISRLEDIWTLFTQLEKIKGKS